jgi:hypothetical protein
VAKKDKHKDQVQVTGWRAVMVPLCGIVAGAVVMLGGIGLLSLLGQTTERGDSPRELMVVIVFTPIAIAAGTVGAYFTWARPIYRTAPGNKDDAQHNTDEGKKPNQQA